jgi:diacylglycerol kinase family enzyme
VLRELAKGPPRTVTVLPLGSANNIARALGLGGREPEELVAAWETGERRRFRLGEVEAGAETRTFLESVGGGLFAESIRQAERVETEDTDKVELGLRVLRRLVDELPVEPWGVELDGADASGYHVAVEAMVIGQTGPQIPLAPAADPEDARLDVVLIGDADRAQAAAYLDDRLAGRPASAPRLTVRRCREAVLRPPPSAPLRIDDELWQDVRSDVRARTSGWVEVLTPR